MEAGRGRNNEATRLEQVKVVVYVVDYIDSIYSSGKLTYYYNLYLLTGICWWSPD